MTASDQLPLAPDQLVPAKAFALAGQVDYVAGSVVSRTLAKKPTGTITLFAFDAGQGLTEHTSPFDALVIVLAGSFVLTIGGSPVRAPQGSIVRMPADVPHAVDAPEPARMLLIMLRERTPS